MIITKWAASHKSFGSNPTLTPLLVSRGEPTWCFGGFLTTPKLYINSIKALEIFIFYNKCPPQMHLFTTLNWNITPSNNSLEGDWFDLHFVALLFNVWFVGLAAKPLCPKSRLSKGFARLQQKTYTFHCQPCSKWRFQSRNLAFIIKGERKYKQVGTHKGLSMLNNSLKDKFYKRIVWKLSSLEWKE